MRSAKLIVASLVPLAFLFGCATQQPQAQQVTEARESAVQQSTGKDETPVGPVVAQIEQEPRTTPPIMTRGRKPLPPQFWLRIGFFNDSKEKPLSRNARMWIRGFGDFWPVSQEGWRFGGTVIEKAGPFGTDGTYGSENVIYFYPDYSDESKVIKVPFKYSAEMNPEGSPRDMVTVEVGPETIVFWGRPIRNATGRLQHVFDRDTCRQVDQVGGRQ